MNNNQGKGLIYTVKGSWTNIDSHQNVEEQ